MCPARPRGMSRSCCILRAAPKQGVMEGLEVSLFPDCFPLMGHHFMETYWVLSSIWEDGTHLQREP